MLREGLIDLPHRYDPPTGTNAGYGAVDDSLLDRKEFGCGVSAFMDETREGVAVAASHDLGGSRRVFEVTEAFSVDCADPDRQVARIVGAGVDGEDWDHIRAAQERVHGALQIRSLPAFGERFRGAREHV